MFFDYEIILIKPSSRKRATLLKLPVSSLWFAVSRSADTIYSQKVWKFGKYRQVFRLFGKDCPSSKHVIEKAVEIKLSVVRIEAVEKSSHQNTCIYIFDDGRDT